MIQSQILLLIMHWRIRWGLLASEMHLFIQKESQWKVFHGKHLWIGTSNLRWTILMKNYVSVNNRLDMTFMQSCRAMLRRSVCCQEKINKCQKVACFRAFFDYLWIGIWTERFLSWITGYILTRLGIIWYRQHPHRWRMVGFRERQQVYEASVLRPRLVDKMSRSCGRTPGKVAGQRATVKAEINGFIPGLDCRPSSRWTGKAANLSKCLATRAL